MQERRLRLGDVLDDYCPREKRLTNHVIVALVEDDVRQTRCSTCDYEHVYKGGNVPTRRKKVEPQAALYKTVLENITGRDAETGGPLARAHVEPEQPAAVAAAAVVPPRVIGPPDALPPGTRPPAAVPPPDGEPVPTREEPVHRHQLIRATLPKVEGQVQERKPADFTLWNVSRQPQARHGGGRPRPQGQGPGQGQGSQWGGYSPYANGHPGGKSARPGAPSGRPPRQNSNTRRGR